MIDMTITLDALIDEYGGAIYKFCIKLTQSRDDADDLYQETFLKALEHLHKIDRGMNPKGYLFSICVNLWKSSHRRCKGGMVSLDELDDAALVDAGFDVEAFVMAREQAKIVADVIGTLDDKYRLPLQLYYTAECSVSEVAKILKIPQGTVKSRLFKVRTLLKKRLEAEKYEH